MHVYIKIKIDNLEKFSHVYTDEINNLLMKLQP